MPLLWLTGLVTWAAWRLWSRQPDWYGGLVEAGLLIVVLFSFIATAAVASYKHPAWVVSWEWAGLLAAFFLVRQIARQPSDQRHLLAALLATGVCLAAQSLYQRAFPDPGRTPFPGLQADDLPRLRAELLGSVGAAPQNPFPANLPLPGLAAATQDKDPTLYERIALRHNVRPESGEPVLPLALRPRPPTPPAATFRSTENLAGVLALLLPALVGCVVAAWLTGAPRWRLGVAVACTLLTGLALWLTQARSAIVPCLLVGAVASVLAWRHYSSRPAGSPGPSPRVLLLLGLGGPALLLVLAFALVPRGGGAFTALTQRWAATCRMIDDHFWLGVGPGNFGRHAAQSFPVAEAEVARQPDDFALEIWATAGVVAVVGLGVALVAFFRRTLRFAWRAPLAPLSPVLRGEGPGVRGAEEHTPSPPTPLPRSTGGEGGGSEEDDGRTRWEFYEGGMAGLLVGFLIRALPLGADVIMSEAVIAGVRAVVWFAVFALLSDIRWSGATRVLACSAGVAVLVLHMGVEGGISVPGVAQPLWVMAALALNGLPEAPLPFGRQFVGRILPLALSAAAALACLMQVFQPATAGASADRTALAVGQKFLDVRAEVTVPAAEPGKVERITRKNEGGALETIVRGNKEEDFPGLEDAVQADPGNARYWTDVANWYGTLYATFPANDGYRMRALRYAQTAQNLDPLGEEGYLAEARVHLIAAARALVSNPARQTELRKQATQEAPKKLLEATNKHPADAYLHYRAAEALDAAGSPLAREYAAKALKLSDAIPPPGPRLSDAQREHARRLAAGT